MISRKMKKILSESDISSSVEAAYGGHTKPVTSMIYFKDQRRIVTSSMDTEVKIWNVDTCVCEKAIGVGYMVLNMIKFGEDDNLFLTCTTSAEICSYSTTTMEKVKSVFRHTRGFTRMLKLTDDLILALADDLLVIRYSNGKLEKMLTRQMFEIHGSCLVRSEKFKNCFYMNCSWKDGYKIMQIDYEKNEVENVFSDHDDAVFAMAVFTNPKGEEILLAFQGISGFRSILYFYKVEGIGTKSIRKINLGSGDDIKKVNCCCLVGKRYVFISQNDGVVSLIDLKEEEEEGGYDEKGIIWENKVHTESISVIIELETVSVRREVRIACSGGGFVNVRVSGLELEEKVLDTDREERIDFLWKYVDRNENDDVLSKFRIVGLSHQKKTIVTIKSFL